MSEKPVPLDYKEAFMMLLRMANHACTLRGMNKDYAFERGWIEAIVFLYRIPHHRLPRVVRQFITTGMGKCEECQK